MLSEEARESMERVEDACENLLKVVKKERGDQPLELDKALKHKPMLKGQAKKEILDYIFTQSFKNIVEDCEVTWHLWDKKLLTEEMFDQLLEDWKRKLGEII